MKLQVESSWRAAINKIHDLNSWLADTSSGASWQFASQAPVASSTLMEPVKMRTSVPAGTLSVKLELRDLYWRLSLQHRFLSFTLPVFYVWQIHVSVLWHCEYCATMLDHVCHPFIVAYVEAYTSSPTTAVAYLFTCKIELANHFVTFCVHVLYLLLINILFSNMLWIDQGHSDLCVYFLYCSIYWNYII